MIYILTESIMNGTVTMKIITTGIEADTFAKAKIKIKQLSNFYNVTILEDNDMIFRFSMPSVHGIMHNQPLQIL